MKGLFRELPRRKTKDEATCKNLPFGCIKRTHTKQAALLFNFTQHQTRKITTRQVKIFLPSCRWKIKQDPHKKLNEGGRKALKRMRKHFSPRESVVVPSMSVGEEANL